jgi:hypothetical protein
MKRFFGIMAILVGLGGCSDMATEPAADTPRSKTLAADGKPSAGYFRAIDAEGEVLFEQLRPDGTYRFANLQGVTLEEGRWEQKSPALLCFTANRETADEICYREEIGPDGIWRSVDTNTGAIARIERMEAQARP